MDSKITKASDTEIEIAETKSTIVALVDLKSKLETAQRDVTNLDEWYDEEKPKRQKLVDDIQAQITQAEGLGVVDAISIDIVPGLEDIG